MSVDFEFTVTAPRRNIRARLTPAIAAFAAMTGTLFTCLLHHLRDALS